MRSEASREAATEAGELRVRNEGAAAQAGFPRLNPCDPYALQGVPSGDERKIIARRSFGGASALGLVAVTFDPEGPSLHFNQTVHPH